MVNLLADFQWKLGRQPSLSTLKYTHLSIGNFVLYPYTIQAVYIYIYIGRYLIIYIYITRYLCLDIEYYRLLTNDDNRANSYTLACGSRNIGWRVPYTFSRYKTMQYIYIYFIYNCGLVLLRHICYRDLFGINSNEYVIVAVTYFDSLCWSIGFNYFN